MGTSDDPATNAETGTGTREALMEAALDHLGRRGVLAGLNLREVADAAGVTPANIYHHFGSRQGLLRAAIAHRLAQLTAPIDVAVHGSLVEWRTSIFDLVQSLPEMRSTALLALDEDPDYEPIPLWELAQEHYGRLIDEGELDTDTDVVALHLVTLGASMAVSIYGDGAARQLGMSRAELEARSRAMLVDLLEGYLERQDRRRT
ncbi:MAG: TetR/AcrR family transcriptional regulator [Acidimicrobiia bacterium]|nr:TetR/AcrR family transcriptional regulator [Acidimicrobiia bacterium]